MGYPPRPLSKNETKCSSPKGALVNSQGREPLEIGSFTPFEPQGGGSVYRPFGAFDETRSLTIPGARAPLAIHDAPQRGRPSADAIPSA